MIFEGKSWKEVLGYKGYFINHEGEILSTNKGKPRLLKLQSDKDGYKTVCIRDKTGKKKILKLHRVVAEHFLERVDSKNQVCHKDGNKANNNFQNLYWGTAKENNSDKLLHGTVTRGEKCHLSKLNEKSVKCVRAMLKAKIRVAIIAKLFKVSLSTIKAVKLGTTWSWLK